MTDHERPLNSRGRNDAPRMGQLLAAQGLRPDRVLSSTAVRALTTAQAVIEAAGFDVKIEQQRDFYLAPTNVYIGTLAQLPEACSCVLIVGHNPGMELLVNQLTGQHVTFPTAALAHVELSMETWPEFTGDYGGQLVNLWLPRELP